MSGKICKMKEMKTEWNIELDVKMGKLFFKGRWNDKLCQVKVHIKEGALKGLKLIFFKLLNFESVQPLNNLI